MFRIKALNCSKANGNNELQLAKEAQETIFESEYIRAISLINRGQRELAGNLFCQLLQTEVINEVNSENAEKIWTIRYNCHKHLALMFNDAKNNKDALCHYLFAMTIDNTDVPTLYRFGQLSLQLGNMELGAYVFETCLLQNKKNWRATNGLLQVYIKSLNLIAIYELSLTLAKNNLYTNYAIDILTEIHTKFKSFVLFYEKVFKKPNYFKIRRLEQLTTTTTRDSILNTQEFRINKLYVQPNVPNGLPSLDENDLRFYCVGKYLQIVLRYLDQNSLSMLFKLTVNDICRSQNTHSQSILKRETEQSENSYALDFLSNTSNSKEIVSDKPLRQTATTEDNICNINENPSSIIDQEISKSKSRRRCSDLHLLEQWGWHKVRKTSKKKSLQERPDMDYSLQGFFKRAFSKYLKPTSYDSWPYSDVDHFQTDNVIKKECSKCTEIISLNDMDTNGIFNEYFKKVKIENFDLMLLNFWWLKELSQLWDKGLTSDLKTLYIELFPFFLNSFEFSYWHQIGIVCISKICLFYLELEYSIAREENRELSTIWTTTFDYITSIFDCATIELQSIFGELHLRILNAEYLLCNSRNDTGKAVQVLQHIEHLLLIEKEIHVHLPNIKSFCVTYHNVKNKRQELEWVIKLKEVPCLYKNHQWSELSTLIKEFVQNTDNWHKCNSWLVDFKNLNELLLQCLWNNWEFEECLLFAEKFLHYSTHYYLKENKVIWVKSITYALSFIETIISNEGNYIVDTLGTYLNRLIQNIVNILTYQLDSGSDKKEYLENELEMRNSWMILHKILLRDEFLSPEGDITDLSEDFVPMSFMLLFTAHEYLGNNQICSSDGGQFLQYIYNAIIPNLGAPIYDSCRNNIYEFIEQVTYCLFGFPPKKARSKHLEDHNSTLTELTWEAGIDIFDIYAPETLPEFNSYKIESITSDMEQFYLKLLALMPQKMQLMSEINKVNKFVEGAPNSILNESANDDMPHKLKNLYYLLADYYFKSRDFKKAIKYYTYDLAIHKVRLDSWAGISLSKASNIETSLNGLFEINVPEFLCECEEVIRCFDKCISLVQNRILLWIEYGSFAYTVASFCSRTVKHLKEKNNVDWISLLAEKISKMLTIANNCFTLANTLQCSDMSNIELLEEKWLCQYMLGKIAEKRKEKPDIYLNYYLSAANCLYECNASYPIKINHNNPTTLSIEALEVFYRTNSAIIKYLQKDSEVTKETLSLFKNVLKKLSNSPFAFNKAKVDDNNIYYLKRKSVDIIEAPLNKKAMLEVERHDLKSSKISLDLSTNSNFNKIEESKDIPIVKKKDMRRLSQESSATSITFTTISTSPLSHLETDSDSSMLDIQTEGLQNCNSELEIFYEEALKNLEECVIRFPEHYKSLYRLIYFYMNGPSKFQDLSQCEKLLLSQYNTRVGNIINGLFFDRKASNIFYGIWRIPSPEIDRPGSFSSHLVKCVKILIEVLHKKNDFKLLMEIILQLYKTPDNDKRYILDSDRIELYELAMNYCEGSMREILNNNIKFRNDTEILNLLIDIYKIQKRCFKYMVQKAAWFSNIFVDVYLFFIENKVHNLPKDLNYTELAIKLCQQEINLRKALGKESGKDSLNESQIRDAVLVLNKRVLMKSEECSRSIIESNLNEYDKNNEILE